MPWCIQQALTNTLLERGTFTLSASGKPKPSAVLRAQLLHILQEPGAARILEADGEGTDAGAGMDDEYEDEDDLGKGMGLEDMSRRVAAQGQGQRTERLFIEQQVGMQNFMDGIQAKQIPPAEKRKMAETLAAEKGAAQAAERAKRNV